MFTAKTQILPMSELLGEENQYTQGYYAVEVIVYSDGQETFRKYADWMNLHNAKLHKNIYKRQVLADANS